MSWWAGSTRQPAGLPWRTLGLLLVLALALGLRLLYLVPPERGLLFAADTDEGIYAASARLVLDGYTPYKDYFCSAPPLGLYLFMSVLRPFSVPWGNETGFMALRYTSVVYGMITVVTVYAIGRRNGGYAAGLLAASLLAIDGWVVGQDRRAMLEAPMNMFSALAVLALTVGESRRQRSLLWYVLAGILSALAMLCKTQGMMTVAALLLCMLLRRQWRGATLIGFTACVVYAVFAMPFLLVASDELVRQLFVFQLLRPPNGDPAIMLRVNAIRSFAESWLTVRLGLLGAGLLLLRWVLAWGQGRYKGRIAEDDDARRWLPVLVWAVVVGASFALSRTFYLYYYVQLAVPLALLGGSLLSLGTTERRHTQAWRQPHTLVAVLLLAVLCLLRLPTQADATLTRLRWTKPAYAEMGRMIAEKVPATTPILAFEPNYLFLTSRPLHPLADGRLGVDVHAYMLYTNLGIAHVSWAELLASVGQRRLQDEQALLWQSPAQRLITEVLPEVQYVLVDRLGRYVLSPETLRAVEEAAVELATSGDASLRAR